jgi:putative spermidine/putrescine transport system permease protein
MSDLAPVGAPLPRLRWRRFARPIRSSALGGSVLGGPAVLLLLGAFVGPIVILVGYSFGFFDQTVETGVSLYREILADGFTRGVILSTVRLAFTVTVVTFLIGYPLAWVIARSKNRTRAFLTAMVIAPLLTNVVVRTMGWVVILAPRGIVNTLLPGEPIAFLGNMVGVSISLSHVFLPFMVLPLVAVIENIRPELRESAVVHGAHPIVAFWRVLLPLSMPGIVAGCTLVFLLTSGSLVTPSLIGQKRVWVLTTLIYQQVTLGNWGEGGALAMSLFLIAIVVIRLSQRLSDRSTGRRTYRPRGRVREALRSGSVVTSGVFRGLPSFAGFGRAARTTYVVLIIGFIILPLVMVVKTSFDASGRLWAGWGGFTLDHFSTALGDRGWIDAFLLSLRLALSAVTLGLLVGIPAAWAVVRGSFPGRGPLLAFLTSPLAIPHLVLGLGFLLYFRILAFRPSFGRLLLVHLIIVLPFIIRTVVAAIHGMDERLEESARTLGANQLTTFRRIIVPLVKPAIISAALFAFLVSLDEVTVTLFVAGTRDQPLAVRMFGAVVHDVFSPGITAISTVLIGLSTIVLLLIGKVIGYSNFVARE